MKINDDDDEGTIMILILILLHLCYMMPVRLHIELWIIKQYITMLLVAMDKDFKASFSAVIV